MSYFKHILQDVQADANNSSTTNLAVGNSYTFTGTATSTLGVAGIQVSLFADKNCTIKVEQSPDSTPHWDLIDTYYYTANGNFGITVQAISSFVRVVVTTNLETTTTFRLQTALCPIVEAVPRSLDGNQNFKIGMGIDVDNFQGQNTPHGDTRTIVPFRLVGKQFDFYGYNGAPDTNFWLTQVDATGTPGSVTISNSLCTLNSGTNTASFSKLLSHRRAAYFGGYANHYTARVRISTSYSNNTKRWGVAAYSDYTFTVTASISAVGDVYSNNGQYFTVMQPNAGGTTLYCKGTGAPSTGNLVKVLGAAGSTGTVAFSASSNNWVVSDGVLFQISGTTFSCQAFKNGTATPITNFNGHLGGSYTPSTDVHRFEIIYDTSSVYFIVDGALLHILSSLTTNWAATMNFWIYADNVNSGNTTNTILGFRSASIRRLGPDHTMPAVKHISGNAATYICKTGPGMLHKIIYNNTSGTSLTIYDGIAAITGTELGIITTASGALGSWMCDIPFYTGLTLVTAGNGLDATIVYE